MKIWIDCDTGVDDSLAILFALYHPDIEVVGISTSTGNVSAHQGAENTLRILKLAGMEGKIPVCAGAEESLTGNKEPFPEIIHGKNGLGNVELPPSAQKAVDMDVVDFMYQAACEHEGELVLVTLGRMTNPAHVLLKHPDYSRKIRRVVSMGGTVFGPGNVAPMVEANIGGDPEAADLVLQADWDVTLVGLDVTLKTLLRKADIDQAAELCPEKTRPALAFLQEEMKWYMKGARLQNWKRDCCPLHDPLAMIVAVDPGVVTRAQKRITRVECGGTYSRGMIVTDVREECISGRYVEHCLEVDEEKALNTLFMVFWRS